jgi:hypothetical protein
MTSYTSSYPTLDFDPAYKQFFEDFYAISDTPDAHDKYVDSFTEDATLIMASKKAKGSEGSLSPSFSLFTFIPSISLLIFWLRYPSISTPNANFVATAYTPTLTPTLKQKS